jgi:hypothetical protein
MSSMSYNNGAKPSLSFKKGRIATPDRIGACTIICTSICRDMMTRCAPHWRGLMRSACCCCACRSRASSRRHYCSLASSSAMRRHAARRSYSYASLLRALGLRGGEGIVSRREAVPVKRGMWAHRICSRRCGSQARRVSPW